MESVEFWQAAWNTWQSTLFMTSLGVCGVYIFSSSNLLSAVSAAVVVLTDIGLAMVDLGYGTTNNETIFLVFGFLWVALAILYTFNFIRYARRTLNEDQKDESSCSPGG